MQELILNNKKTRLDGFFVKPIYYYRKISGFLRLFVFCALSSYIFRSGSCTKYICFADFRKR